MNEAHELLRRALEVLDEKVIGYEITKGSIRCYLANQETAKDEAVAWMLPSGDGYDSNFRDHSTVKSCTGNSWTGWVPLYLHPARPDRKPMTEEELPGTEYDGPYYDGFRDGVYYAEKFHGIGEQK